MSDTTGQTNTTKNVLEKQAVAGAETEKVSAEMPKSDPLDGSVVLRHPVTTAVLATPIAARPVSTQLMRPQWSIAALPQVIVEPAPADHPPVRAGDFLLWPDPDSAIAEMGRVDFIEDKGELPPRPVVNPIHTVPVSVINPVQLVPIVKLPPIFFRPVPLQRAFFALAVPHLLDLSLTVLVTVQPDNSIKVSSGTATLTVGIYAQEDLQVLDHNRQGWTDALSQAGYTNRIWKFVPQNLRNLQAALDIPQDHKAGEPQVSTNTNSGTATFVVALSEAGALVWKNALEQHNGSAIPGLCRLTASYYGRSQNGIDVKDQGLNVPLGTLLASGSSQNVHTINPQQTIESVLLVIGNDLVQSVMVTMKPNMGQAPETQVFNSEGGQVRLSITTQDVSSAEVDWTAQVAYKPSGWPVIPASGKLPANNSWTEAIKPDSWIANYTIMALLVDANGKAIPISNAGSNYHVNGILTFTAPYIPTTNVLVSPFDASNQIPVMVALPRFPDQPFGDLLLNVFATRDGVASTQTRRLTATDPWIVVMVYPDAHLDIKTSADPLPELSSVSEMMARLAMLR